MVTSIYIYLHIHINFIDIVGYSDCLFLINIVQNILLLLYYIINAIILHMLKIYTEIYFPSLF